MSDGTTAHEEGEHAEPAVHDWPAGVPETSVWPLVATLGVATLYTGASLVGMSFGRDAIFPKWPGPVLVLGGLGFFVVGLFGWLYHGFVHRYWTRTIDPHNRLTLRTAMILFLSTELATFGAGFGYYFYIRSRPWPPEHIPHLLSSLVLVNTVLLVTSSVTMHFAEHALRKNKRKRFVRLVGVTLALGVVFLGGQAYEYYKFIVTENYTFTSGIFASGFFGLTGLHGLHVTLGVVLLSIVFVRGWLLDHYSAKRLASVSTVSMYWHFVDAVWLFLVASVYVGGSLGVP